MFRRGRLSTVGLVFASLLASSMAFGKLSDECIPLQYVNDTKDEHLNYVILPFGYQGDMATFQRDARRMMDEGLLKERPLAGYSRINVFAVTRENDRSLACYYSGRYIGCNNTAATQLAMNVCGSDRDDVYNTFKVLVVYNSQTYGGGGSDVATAFSGPLGPRVAIHEIGHSYGDLSDEYLGGSMLSANCSRDSRCSPWQDLRDAGVEGVTCMAGCMSGGTYRSGNTLMKDLDKSFEPVNERYLCCKLAKDTGGIPESCDFFNQGNGQPLAEFCSLPKDVTENVFNDRSAPWGSLRRKLQRVAAPALIITVGKEGERFGVVRTQKTFDWGARDEMQTEERGGLRFEIHGKGNAPLVLERETTRTVHGYRGYEDQPEPAASLAVARQIFKLGVPQDYFTNSDVERIKIFEGKRLIQVIEL